LPLTKWTCTTKSKNLYSDHDFISVVHYYFDFVYYIFASFPRHNPGCPVLCHFAHIIYIYHTPLCTYFNNKNRYLYVLAVALYYIVCVEIRGAQYLLPRTSPPPGGAPQPPHYTQSDNPGVKFTSPAAAFVSHFISDLRALVRLEELGYTAWFNSITCPTQRRSGWCSSRRIRRG